MSALPRENDFGPVSQFPPIPVRALLKTQLGDSGTPD
jgi:hypothetical protein